MCVPVRLSIKLPFSPRIEGALLPTGSIEQRNEKPIVRHSRRTLPIVGYRISLSRAREHYAGTRALFFPAPFHFTRQRGGFAPDWL